MPGRGEIRRPEFDLRNPRPERRPAAGGGFTLLEILLAIALIGLLAAVLVSASANLMGDKPQTAEDVFWKAVQQARAGALGGEKDIRLSYDPKERNFILDDGAAPQTLPVPASAPKELAVDFLSAQKGGSTVLIGGALVDTQTIKYVTFYGDGTCSPFRIQFRTSGPARIVEIDPWTCAQVLKAGRGT